MLVAGTAELLEARAWLDDDDAVVRQLGAPSSTVVEQIVAIARTSRDELELDDEGLDRPI